MPTWKLVIIWLLACAALWFALDLPWHRVNTGESAPGPEQRD